jgi:hypothetical protein
LRKIENRREEKAIRTQLAIRYSEFERKRTIGTAQDPKTYSRSSQNSKLKSYNKSHKQVQELYQQLSSLTKEPIDQKSLHGTTLADSQEFINIKKRFYQILEETEFIEIWTNIASNPLTPLSVLSMISDRVIGERIGNTVIEDQVKRTDEDKKFFYRNHDILKLSLARNPSIPGDIFCKYLDCKDVLYERRLMAGQDPSISIELLEQMSKYPCVILKRRVAKNLSTSLQLLEKLGRDDDVVIRMEVAHQINRVSHDLREELIHDPMPHVRQIVASTVDFDQYLLGNILNYDESYAVRLVVVRRPDLSIKFMKRYGALSRMEGSYDRLIHDFFARRIKYRRQQSTVPDEHQGK